MGKVLVYGGKFYFKAYFVLFLFFFFISSGLRMTPDLFISRKGVKDAMMQEEEDRMASGLRVA